MVKNYLLILFLGALSLLAQDMFAVTAVPWPVEKTQPDGTVISVYLRGDEQVHWMESADGYTLMYDDQKYVVYAKQDERGHMVPSNIRYGGVSVQSSSPKGLRYSEDQVRALKQIWEITSGSDMQRSSGQQKAGATTGSRKALCVLVGFSDRPFGKTVAEYETLFNQVGLYPSDGSVKGSVKDFFHENSYGQLDFTVTVVGPYVAPKPTAYYADQNNYQEFATFAATAAVDDVDYTEFADNGVLETFHILFAGYGDESIGNGQQIWSHKWQLFTPITLDDVLVSVYSCSPELRGNSGNNITYIGVICHELSHVFGSPDYYDTGYAGYPGTGYWDLMASGSWNDNGRQPAHINMFQKMLYGWVTPVALTTQTTVTDMPASASEPVAYTIQANDNGELYILDNKQWTGFDESLPGHGLLIWHVHPAALGGSGSNSAHPQQLYPVAASSTTAIPNSDPASYGAVDSPGAPFPGSSGNTSFAGNTTPTMFTWTGFKAIGKPVTEITETDGTISFKFLDGPTAPVTDLVATVTDNNVRLDWTPPVGDDIQEYQIFRNGVFQFSVNKDKTTHTQVGVPKGNYDYCVSVIYSVTESEKTCIPVAVTTGSEDIYLPVSDLRTTVGADNIKLSWGAPGAWTGIAGDVNGAYYFGYEWDFFAGTLWNPSDLKQVNGFQITKIRFVPLEYLSDGATYTVAIYEVPASGEPILLDTKNVTSSLNYAGVYNEITLDNPITIDATKGVIVGMQVHTVGGSCLPISQGNAYPGRNIFYDEESGWTSLENVGVPLGLNYCLQVYLDGDPGSSSVLPDPNIPVNTSFLKKNSSKKLISGEIAASGPSQAASVVAAYHIYRDGVEIGTSPTASYTDIGLDPLTAYAYCVTVEYVDGGSSEGVCMETETAYQPVTNLKAQVLLDEVTLSWEPIIAYTMPVTYKVYKSGELMTEGLTSPQYTLTNMEIGLYNCCVIAVYDGIHESEKACVGANVESPYRPVTNLKAQVVKDEVTLTWEPQATYATVFEEDFESGIPATWSNVDQDGDGYKWEILSSSNTMPQSGINVATSASYINAGFLALTPDNWLVTPAITLTENNKLRYYVSAQDASFASEHYGVYISTSNTVPGTFTLLTEETMIASPGKPAENPVPGAFRSSGPQYIQGAWYERTIDLSEYDGQTVYIAFRHFDCTDKYQLNLDNVKILSPINVGEITYNVYEEGELIADGLTSPQHTLTDVEIGTYIYCVTAVYDGVNESETTCVSAIVESPYRPVLNLNAQVAEEEVTLTWEPQITYETVFEEDFEGGIPTTWNNVDQDDDSYKWEILSFPNTTPQSGNRIATSASYSIVGPLTPDNWLVTPAITLTDNNKLRYYVSAAEAFWPEEHYGVYISTSNAVPGTFVKLLEETITASPGKPVDSPAPSKVFRSEGPLSVQGAWYERMIDLSEYNGQTVYLAFRHFDCEDQWSLNLDNVKILVPVDAGVITYNVYADGQQIAGGLTSPQYVLNGVEVGTHNYCVTAVYDGSNESEKACVDATVAIPYPPVRNLRAQVVEEEVSLTWEPQTSYMTLFEEDFESGIPDTWENIDQDGDEYAWEILPLVIPQSGSGSVSSASYVNFVGPLTPDNWLVTPAITLADNSKLSYYVSAQDAGWAAEHYGVYISTSNTVPGTFTLLTEETMIASPGKPVDNPAPGAFRSEGPLYVQGAWYERTIDLSEYNGQTVYIAFRHFDCTDKYYLNLDNVKIQAPVSESDITYNVYEKGQLIANGLTSPQYTLSGVETGTHNYCVTAVYYGVTESRAVCVDAVVTASTPAEVFYTLNIPSAEGLIIDWGAGPNAVSENAYVTLTFRAAEGYSIAGMHVYANGTEKTLTTNGEGVYRLALGYLVEDITITVDGIEESGSVGNMASPENGVLRVVKADGGLYVYGLKPGIEFRIYSVSGLLVYQGKAIETEQFIPLRDRGFYIIVSDGSSVKAAL